MTSNLMGIQIGDWISGTSDLDEKFIGYVDSMTIDNIAKIWVSQSDHNEIVGDFVQTKLSNIKKLTVNPKFTQDELSSLMDLALMTKDKEWFQDLISESIMWSINFPALNNESPSKRNDTFKMNWRSSANKRNL